MTATLLRQTRIRAGKRAPRAAEDSNGPAEDVLSGVRSVYFRVIFGIPLLLNLDAGGIRRPARSVEEKFFGDSLNCGICYKFNASRIRADGL